MQVGRLADLAERQARFSRPLKTLASGFAGFLVFIPGALELRLGALHVGAGFPLRIVRHPSGAYSSERDTFRPMTDPFIRPLAADARVLVELDGRPLEHYAVMLQLRIEGRWQTIRLFDNAHGDHDMHRYTEAEKQPAERFAEGTVSEVAPMAIRYLIDHWEAIAESWKS
jgi:hypothetical protein